LLDLSRVYAYLAKSQWFRQVSQVGTRLMKVAQASPHDWFRFCSVS
jgi:hypothetical protein